MKKLLAWLLVCLLLCASVAVAEEPDVGGWTIPASNEMTEELQLLFEKGMAELVGVDYVPMALLETQLVAGTNYCFLCQATVVYPDAKPYYALVYLYEDLQGQVSVLQIDALSIGLHAADDVTYEVTE